MNRIRSFLYRSPRFKANCRMDFICGDTVFLGVCTDLSESGLHGTFSEDVAPGSEGLITLYDDELPFPVSAKVFSVRGEEVRIRFNFASEKERAAMAVLIKALATRAHG